MNNTGFVAGTLVHTDKGLIPIQDIKVGDMVLSRPEWGGNNASTEYKRVSRAFLSGKDVIYRIVYIDNKEECIEPPRVYRRVIYLSQAAMPDRVKLS